MSSSWPISTQGAAIWLFLTALIVLGLGLLWLWLKRRGNARLTPSSIEVIEHKRLGPQQSLCLVRVGSRVLLLGHGNQGLQMLGDMSDALPASAQPSTPSYFEDLLRQAAANARRPA